jgi:hypothetical protein
MARKKPVRLELNPNSEVEERGGIGGEVKAIRVYAKQSYCRPTPNHPDED